VNDGEMGEGGDGERVGCRECSFTDINGRKKPAFLLPLGDEDPYWKGGRRAKESVLVGLAWTPGFLGERAACTLFWFVLMVPTASDGLIRFEKVFCANSFM